MLLKDAKVPAATNSGRVNTSKWHVATICLLALGYSGYYFCRSDYSVALPLILAEQVKQGVNAHVAEMRLGSIASLGVFAYAVGKFPAGAIADRFGGRKNFLGGMAGAILFTLLFMAGGGFPIFTFAWIGNRFAQSLGWAGVVKVTSRWFAYSTYGGVMALLSLSYLVGDAISRSAMALLLANGMSWRGLFATGAGILAVLLLLNIFFLRESPEAHCLPPPDENPLNLFANTGESPSRPATTTIFRTLLRSSSFWLACVLSLGTTLLRETFNLWTPTYLTQALGMTVPQAASGSALFPFFGGLSVLLAGFCSDYLGAIGRSYILFGGLVFTAMALLGLAHIPPHAPRLLPLSLVATVAFSLIGPYSYLAGAMSLDFGGKEGSATASGLIDGVGYLAGVISGDGMAHIAISYGWQRMFFVLACVAALSGLVAGLALLQQRKQALEALSEGAA